MHWRVLTWTIKAKHREPHLKLDLSTILMSAKRAPKLLAALFPNVPAPKKRRNNPKEALIKPTTLPLKAFIPLDQPASKHCDKARGPKNTEPSPIAFFGLSWDESVLDQIVEVTNAHTLAKRAAYTALVDMRPIGTLHLERYSSSQRKWKPLNKADPPRLSALIF